MSEDEEQFKVEVINTAVNLLLNRMELEISNSDSSSDNKKKRKKGVDNSGRQTENSGTVKKKKSISISAQFKALGLLPPPQIPDNFKNKIESVSGREINLFIQKFITKTDDNNGENRLLMPWNQLITGISASQEEEEELDCKKNKAGMKAMLIEPSLAVSHIHLIKWKNGEKNEYVLKNEWNQVRKRNGDNLKKDSVIQVWSFRVGLESKLGFAIVKVGHRLDLDMNPNMGPLLDLNKLPEEQAFLSN